MTSACHQGRRHGRLLRSEPRARAGRQHSGTQRWTQLQRWYEILALDRNACHASRRQGRCATSKPIPRRPGHRPGLRRVWESRLVRGVFGERQAGSPTFRVSANAPNTCAGCCVIAQHPRGIPPWSGPTMSDCGHLSNANGSACCRLVECGDRRGRPRRLSVLYWLLVG